jgi:hypothetical protein
MTIGVVWEFFEFFMDVVFRLDMQKDTVLTTIRSVSLDPTNSQRVITLSGIEEVVVNGKPLGVGGYLDIGLFDTMEDLFVNFIGALAFSIAGYFYVKYRSKKAGFLRHFVPTLGEKEEPR